MATKYLRWFAYIIDIIIFFAIQQTPGLIPLAFGSKPILLIPILISIALFEDEITGLWFGVFIGLLMDFGFSNILGFNCILMAIFGYLLGFISANFIKVNLLSGFICAVLISLIAYLMHFVFFYLLQMYENYGYILLNNYLPRLIYTIIVFPIFYLFNKSIAIHIRPKED